MTLTRRHLFSAGAGFVFAGTVGAIVTPPLAKADAGQIDPAELARRYNAEGIAGHGGGIGDGRGGDLRVDRLGVGVHDDQGACCCGESDLTPGSTGSWSGSRRVMFAKTLGQEAK